MKRHPDIPINPPARFSRAVGEVALRWSRLEYQLGVLVRVGFKLSKDEQRTLIFGMEMAVLAGILKGMSRGWLVDRNLATAITQLATEAAELRKRRGEFVHGLYGRWLGTSAPWQLFKLRSHRQRGVINAEEIRPDDIKTFAVKLRDLQVRAQALTRRLKDVHGSRR